ncbi:MAG: VIT domain-containing protein [Bryobacteraceae bacterium]|nr:VIT domain-containing protein [Bryobacteraceae bacterium]
MQPRTPLIALLGLFAGTAPSDAAPVTKPGAGALTAIDREGRLTTECPLKRTEVKAEITGFLSRVTVTQNFENTSSSTIEAVYTFPLPPEGAVDRMMMHIGARAVEAKIKPREEARAIFDAARQAGKRASLLEQERPNIFTQSVTNIRPGDKVRIVLSYVAPLKYEAGTYEFVYPMVVGPRYIPGGLPDAARITPPVAVPDSRAGHDITVDVSVDAGVPIRKIESGSHQVTSEQPDPRQARVRLKDLSTIPNKDFILKYAVAGARMEDAVLAHKGANGGFFTLILQPPDRVPQSQITPKELVFVLDTSGSMHGFPMDKSKELMRMALGNMNPEDTFNIITFAGDTHLLFSEPVPATAENVARARAFVEGRRGSGGTEMMKAVRAALDPSDSAKHVRVVAFLTDGYVGNDLEILGEIRKHPNARVFGFGIGNAVNRFLLDKMSEEGRGEVEYVTLNDDGSAAARRFFERMRTPLLTDVKVDFGGLPVTGVYPTRIPDLFSAKPLTIHGRYGQAARGVIRISGKIAGKEYTRQVNVDLPATEARHDVLAPLWARARIDDLMSQDYRGMQSGNVSAELRNEITRLGLDFRLMTQFTAFVAVEEKVVNEGGKVRRVEVPVEMPEGVSHEGVFGEAMPMQAAYAFAPPFLSQRANKSLSMGTVFRRMPAEASTPRAARDSARQDASLNPMAKIHPTLAAALSAKTAAKLHVRIYLTGNTAKAIEELKALGLEVQRQEPSGGFIIGYIEAAKLEALAKSPLVRYLSPAL